MKLSPTLIFLRISGQAISPGRAQMILPLFELAGSHLVGRVLTIRHFYIPHNKHLYDRVFVQYMGG